MPVRLGPMVNGSPRAQEKCQAAKLQLASQRVEDNAFHLGVATRFTQVFTRTWPIRWLEVRRMKIYRGFPERLHHRVPYWVEPGGLFHVRIALDREKEQEALTKPPLAQEILDSAEFYQARARWHITLFLLMPDHLHALLSFARDQSCLVAGRIFDHRLRADERGTQLLAKMNYVRQNPVAAGLCAKAEAWPWVIDPFAD
jgi:putative transposase